MLCDADSFPHAKCTPPLDEPKKAGDLKAARSAFAIKEMPLHGVIALSLSVNTRPFPSRV